MKSKTKKCNTKKHGGMRSTRNKNPPKRLTYGKKSPPKKSKRQTKRQTKQKSKKTKKQKKTQTKKLNKLLLNNIKETSKEEIHNKCMECGKGFYTSAECPQKLCGYHRRLTENVLLKSFETKQTIIKYTRHGFYSKLVTI